MEVLASGERRTTCFKCKSPRFLVNSGHAAGDGSGVAKRTGNRLNTLVKIIDEVTSNRLPRKNGAPGNRNGAFDEVKYPNSPVVKTSGEMTLVKLIRDVNAP